MLHQRCSTKTFVPPGALSVHADPDLPRRQQLDEVSGGELAALIGVEDFGLCVTGERFLNGFDAETRLQLDRDPSEQNPTGVQHSGEIDKIARHRNVGDVNRPNLIGLGNR